MCLCYLCNAMVLQVYDSGHGHLHAAEHRHHLQLLIIKRRSSKVLEVHAIKSNTVRFKFR